MTIRAVSPRTPLTGQLASPPTTAASVVAHGLPRRPYHSLLALHAQRTTQLARTTTPQIGNTASTTTTAASMVALGPSTIRSPL